MSTEQVKPLDFVSPIDTEKYGLSVGLVTEVSLCKNYVKAGTDETVPDFYSASVRWLGRGSHPHNSWWPSKDLKVIDNLPNLLTRTMAHPFGHNAKEADVHFPIPK